MDTEIARQLADREFSPVGIRHAAAAQLIAEFADGRPDADRAIVALARLIIDYPHPLQDRAEWIAQAAHMYGAIPARWEADKARAYADVSHLIAVHGHEYQPARRA